MATDLIPPVYVDLGLSNPSFITFMVIAVIILAIILVIVLSTAKKSTVNKIIPGSIQ